VLKRCLSLQYFLFYRNFKIRFAPQMRKNKIVLLCTVAVAVFAVACQSKDKTKADLIKKYEKMIDLNDYQSACFYLQEYLFLDSNNIGYMDSLSRHYIALNTF